MTRSRIPLAVVALPVLLVLVGCGVGTPAPVPSGSPSGASASPAPTADPTGTPTPGDTAAPEAPVEVGFVSVTATSLAVVDAEGELLGQVAYTETDHAAAASRLADLLGLDPVVTTTTAAAGSTCDANRTLYDFGGLLLRSPGFVGTAAAIEARVDGATTTNGWILTTLEGVAVGTPRGAFTGAVGPVVELGADGPHAWVAFDRINPEAAEFDGVGSLARFEDDVLVEWSTPHYFFGDC